MPEQLSPEERLRMFVGINNARKIVQTRDYDLMALCFLNKASIAWYSETQSRITNSVLHPNLLPLGLGLKKSKTLWLSADNISAIHKNASKSESTVKKKGQAYEKHLHYILLPQMFVFL